ncbi:MAG TPA: pyruvate, phosphate dikinase, partial [Victivallales bacterium]|nr:pyruvate, phosphate dikinase [Victivallales bacterium]
TLKAMEGMPVTIRLLDPPLHEFVPQAAERQKELAQDLGISIEDVKKRGESLHETNPMMGHRGVRLGVSYPEISEMQIRAILEAGAELQKEGIKCTPEIMVPVTCDVSELKNQKQIVDEIAEEVKNKFGLKKIDFLYGTMIEIPRAAILAGKMAEEAEFFSFGTNDLTQMSFGFSRDDVGGFMQDYLDKRILHNDPFQILDRDGVGFLVSHAVKEGRKTKPKLKIGICGEHGGEPNSVEFCYKNDFNYVSCSPFRVPIAILASAQAAIKANRKKKSKK